MSTIKIGQTVSYQDQANPYREGIITEIRKKEGGNCFLLFGGKSPMEPITEDIVIIYLGSWHKSIIAGNDISENGHAGHKIVNKPLLTQEAVNAIIMEYERMQPILRAKAMQAEDEKHKQKQIKKERLKTVYPYLIKADETKLSTYALGAKNIRTELKRVFPDIKFSVTSESYSGGCSIDVRWTDGPTEKEVRVITSKYQQGHFDGMNDLYNYSDEVFTDVFGGAQYVSEQREKTETVKND
jgi:hypothetical protein